MKAKRRLEERGFIGIVTALMLVGLLAFAGLAIDVGYMQVMRRRAQNAADAAAMGALRELELGHTGSITAAGQNDASLNGFTDGTGNTTVTINTPPTLGAQAGNSLAVEAVVQQVVPTFFMMVVGRNSIPISARAVGRQVNYVGSIGGCIFALNPSASGSLTVTGNVTITTACSSVVDSTSSSALTMNGNITFNLANHAKLGVVGGWNLNGGASLWDLMNNTSTSPITTQYYADPLAAVPTPTVAGLVMRATSPSSYKKSSMPANNTIDPGIYCGGIDIQNTGGIDIKMNPGLYVMAGGGLSANSQAQLDGTAGVTIYNTSSAGWGCPSAYSFSDLTLNGQAVFKLNAPTSGTYVGVLFFDDRTQSGSPKINGGSSSTFDGALYFKNGALTINGNNSTNGYMVIVADTIKFAGTASLGNNYTTLPANNYFRPTTTGSGLTE